MRDQNQKHKFEEQILHRGREVQCEWVDVQDIFSALDIAFVVEDGSNYQCLSARDHRPEPFGEKKTQKSENDMDVQREKGLKPQCCCSTEKLPSQPQSSKAVTSCWIFPSSIRK